jgi:hypothetical protein
LFSRHYRNHFARPRQHVRGIARPICFALLRLITGSNFAAAPGLFFWTIVTASR